MIPTTEAVCSLLTTVFLVSSLGSSNSQEEHKSFVVTVANYRHGWRPQSGWSGFHLTSFTEQCINSENSINLKHLNKVL